MKDSQTLNASSLSEFPRYTFTRFERATVISADCLPPIVPRGDAGVLFGKIAPLASCIVVVEQVRATEPPTAANATRQAALDKLLNGGLTILIRVRPGDVKYAPELFGQIAPDVPLWIADGAGLRRVNG